MNEFENERYIDGLERFYKKGVDIFVDDIYSSTRDEWYRILQINDKTTYYMADFIDDKSGKLKEIRFKKIKN